MNSLESGVDMPYCSVVPYSTYPCTISSESTSMRALVSVMSVTETLEIEGPTGISGVGAGAVSSTGEAGGLVGKVWASAKNAQPNTAPTKKSATVFLQLV